MQKNKRTEKNIVKKLLRIVRNILIGCGVLFILLLLIPTDEEEVEQDSAETVAVTGEESSFQETASKAESILEAVGEKAFRSRGRNGGCMAVDQGKETAAEQQTTGECGRGNSAGLYERL